MAASPRNERWRPRRGKRGDFRGRTSADQSFLLKDLEERVTTLSADPAGHASELVQLRHVKAIASYSWIDAPVPTIAVPGSPRIWADERPPVRQVPLDTGVQYIHHNASKMGDQSPMLPLFAAIDALHDDFSYKDLDLVTDRNGLRKLFRFVDGAGSEEDNFRIDVDLAGKTCLFTRQEESPTSAAQNVGYGHGYLKATTRAPPGCENMTVHSRIITYKFGSLKILLGFTADACIEPKSDDDDFLASFSSLSIGNKTNETTQSRRPLPAGLDVKLAPARSLVPQPNLVEVKTRSSLREPNWREIYPQLFLSQTPWLYMARHSAGTFEPVEKIALTGEEMKPYADMVESTLGKLKNLLKAVLKAVRDQGEGVPLSLVCQGGTLALWRRKEGSGKPVGDAITARFKG